MNSTATRKMMFRRFLSPRFAVVAVAVTVTLILRCDLSVAQTSDPTPAPTALGTDATPNPSAVQSADEEPSEGYLDCNTEFIGDSQCDEDNNSEICEYDGGDCCACTCVSLENSCGGSYNCIDPDAECVDDDDGDGGTLESNDAAADTEEDDDTEQAETNESDSASGIFAGASLAKIVIAAVAAIGLVVVAP